MKLAIVVGDYCFAPGTVLGDFGHIDSYISSHHDSVRKGTEAQKG